MTKQYTPKPGRKRKLQCIEGIKKMIKKLFKDDKIREGKSLKKRYGRNEKKNYK